jgi:DNA segregation ATPase FtsK/SpoIIIE-like protein
MPKFKPADAPMDTRPRGERVMQQAFWDSNNPSPTRVSAQAVMVSDDDDDDDSESIELTRRELTGDVQDGNEDELYEKAVELVRRLDKASISLLQRRLRIGYTRAARLIDVMEARGVVGPAKDGSSKPRDVLPG